MQMKIASYTAIGNRTENEDTGAFEQVSPEQMYAVVCDGLGSHGGGQEASRVAVTQLQRMRFSQLPTSRGENHGCPRSCTTSSR